MDFKPLNQAEINQLIPQSPPFLLLNQIENFNTDQLDANYCFDAHTSWMQGHFPGDPIVPGVLLCECCLQAGASYMALSQKQKIQGKAIVTKMDKVKFKNFVRPGDELKISVRVIDKIADYTLMNGRITSQDKTIMSLEFMVGVV